MIGLIASFISGGAPWVLACSDPIGLCAGMVIEGRGTPDAISSSSRLITAEGRGIGDYSPHTEALGAEADKGSFTAEWQSHHAFDDVLSSLRDLDLTMRYDPVLGRPPYWELSSGLYSAKIMVTGIERTIATRHWELSGLPVFVRASVNVVVVNEKSYTQLPVELETSYITLGDSDTFESVALSQYGDASLGVGLRRVNPSVVVEEGGQVVKVLDRTHSAMLGGDLMSSTLFAQGGIGEEVQQDAVERLTWGGTPWSQVADDDKEFEGWR